MKGDGESCLGNFTQCEEEGLKEISARPAADSKLKEQL
jgi:hypothetical protein